MKGIAAILLGAGTSSRMGGENKLLLPWGEETMIRHVAGQLLEGPLEDIIVVLGYEAQQVQSVLRELPVRFVHNSSFAAGMTSSIQAGVTALSDDCSAFLVCLGDMPLLTGRHYVALIHFFEEKKKEVFAPIVRPVQGEKKGHPVLFDASYAPEILACGTKDGCREVIQQNNGCFFGFQTEEEVFFKDVDRKGDVDLMR